MKLFSIDGLFFSSSWMGGILFLPYFSGTSQHHWGFLDGGENCSLCISWCVFSCKTSTFVSSSHISLYLHIQKRDLSVSTVNYMACCWLFRCSWNVLKCCSPCCQMAYMSSTYLNHSFVSGMLFPVLFSPYTDWWWLVIVGSPRLHYSLAQNRCLPTPPEWESASVKTTPKHCWKRRILEALHIWKQRSTVTINELGLWSPNQPDLETHHFI